MRAERGESIWLITPGEPLPVDGEDVRLIRTGIFFQRLVARGVRVCWWTAGFDHANRRHRSRELTEVPSGEGGRIVLVPSTGYARSVSPRRLIDHRVIARRFLRAARATEPPDIVYCSYLTIALARAAVAYGLETDTPVVLDVRDLWPDVIWDSVLGRVQGPVRTAALRPMRRAAGWAVQNATAVIGLTDEYVDWALALAPRRRGPLDVAIPVTYPDEDPLDEDQLRDAVAFWRGRGLDLDAAWTGCFLGTMGRQFDFGPVLDAARSLATTHPQIRLVLCGEGDGFAALKSAAASLPNLTLPGWIDGPPRKLLLARAKVGLAPYQPSENFRRNLANKPVEYMAHGLPVIHPLEGVLDRVCREGGCGLRYGESPLPGLAEILAGLADDPQRLAELAEGARGRFQAHHRAEGVTDLLLEHRRAVLASR